MEIKETKLVEEEVIVGIVCDSCGQPLEEKDLTYENYLQIYIRWGYGSLKDGDLWIADMCEKCVDEKLDKIVKFKKVRFNA